MSVSLAPEGVSNPRIRPWLITVIIVLVLASTTCEQIVIAYADAAAFLTLLLGGCGTAAKCRDSRNQSSNPAASSTALRSA
jgi:hypothetical protein